MWDKISKQEFFQNVWQQKAHFFPQSFPPSFCDLSLKKMALLAQKKKASSRLIERRGRQWSCHYGPFDSAQLERLKSPNATLLIHEMEFLWPPSRSVLQHFDFFPQYRFDDLMVSYASQGGGVGPHWDEYDVFLIQAQGTRTWHLGEKKDFPPLCDTGEVARLKSFTPHQTLEVHPGDCLYVPPGWVHWGVATSPSCLTYSVGLRAPSRQELWMSCMETFCEKLPLPHRFEDQRGFTPHRRHKSQLRIQDAKRWMGELAQDVACHEMEIMKNLGRLLTEPRRRSRSLALAKAPRNRSLPFQCIKRWGVKMVYLKLKDQLLLFCEGESFLTHAHHLSTLECWVDSDTPFNVEKPYPPELESIFLTLLKKGVFDVMH